MARIYINADEARITYTGDCRVKMEMYSGEVFEELTPKRLFPLSGLTKYISLLNKDQKEIAIIRDLAQLMPESRAAVEKCLEEFYLIPVIEAVIDRREKFGILKYRVKTNLGEREFEIRNRHSDIKALFDGRILIRDSDDNRYEIPDVSRLDKKSLSLISYDL